MIHIQCSIFNEFVLRKTRKSIVYSSVDAFKSHSVECEIEKPIIENAFNWRLPLDDIKPTHPSDAVDGWRFCGMRKNESCFEESGIKCFSNDDKLFCCVYCELMRSLLCESGFQ